MTTEAVEGSGAHLSIGEVLEQLRREFPDVTISKIRFLESQGLIDPERTPSGYRRFYPPDLARLRWILLQQRDHFLPLRVIKERLDAYGPSGAPRIGSSNGGSQPARPSASSTVPRSQPSVPPRPPSSSPPSASRGPSSSTPPFDAPRREDPSPLQSEPRPATVHASLAALGDDADTEDDEEHIGPLHASSTTAASTDLTRTELLEATGLSDTQLDALESFGMLAPVSDDNGDRRYDDEMLSIAEVAAGCYRRGIEARHLKMYWHFAEREAALFAQVLMPYVKQRNPASRAKLQAELEELARLGRRLRTAMLRRALRDTLTE